MRVEEAFLPAPTVQSPRGQPHRARRRRASAACGSAAPRRAWPTSTCGSRVWRRAPTTGPSRCGSRDDPTRSEQNPVLFPAPDGRLWLLHTAQHAGDQDTSIVRRRTSRDHGAHVGRVRGPCSRASAVASSSASPRSSSPTGAWVLPDLHLRTRARREVGRRPRHQQRVGRRPTRASPGRSARCPGSHGLRAHEHRAAELTAGMPRTTAVGGPTTSTAASSDDGLDVVRSRNRPSCPTTTPRSRPRRCPTAESALVLNESSRLDAVARRVSLYDEIDDDGISDAPRPSRSRRARGARRGPRRLLGRPARAADPRAVRRRRTAPGRCAGSSRTATATA